MVRDVAGHVREPDRERAIAEGVDCLLRTPKCALCGQAHVTGDRTCPNRYQVPYVVRHRRRRRKNSQPTQGYHQTTADEANAQAAGPDPTIHFEKHDATHLGRPSRQSSSRESAQSVNRHPPPPPYPPYPLHPLHPLQIQLLPMQQPRVAPRNAGQLKP
ncbi:hypothetical protein MTO96_017080 [Rhipicephalus appendiculatus]